MASSSGRKTSSSKKAQSRGTQKSTAARKKTAAPRKNSKAYREQLEQERALIHEIGLIVLFVAMVILFLCNFGVIGTVGDTVSDILFGLFGLTAYIVPIAVFVAAAFWFANEGSPTAIRKLIAGAVLFLMMGVLCDLFAEDATVMEKYNIETIYKNCSEGRNGGGVFAGSLTYLLHHYLETVGTVLVVMLSSVISLILVTEKSLFRTVREGSSRIRERSMEDMEYRQELLEQRRQEREAYRQEREAYRRQEREAQRLEREENLRRREQERREALLQQRQEKAEQEKRKEQEKRLKAEARENERILKSGRPAQGVVVDTTLGMFAKKQQRDDVHEITLSEALSFDQVELSGRPVGAEEEAQAPDFEGIQARLEHQVNIEESEQELLAVTGQPTDPAKELWPESFVPSGEVQELQFAEEEHIDATEPEALHTELAAVQEADCEEAEEDAFSPSQLEAIQVHSEATGRDVQGGQPDADKENREEKDSTEGEKEQQVQQGRAPVAVKEYIFPPVKLLNKGAGRPVDLTRELRETAMRLQQTLATFGVGVTITDISQGPSVTRYEMQPEQGVKVSKIVSLTDDIKLNLAATDIRIEAPIPGKAAVGIEVPNKENMPVAFRDLVESREFQEFPSNLAFAVGKDIAGKVVVADIAKMPHMLIAGATGSGKSVCINTLIMSILYKAHPDDVKLIMVDPKVVELSVYNNIPHLLIPVVTDPKKAAAALHWGVSEMTDRYQKFADYNVRDLKGYNQKVEAMRQEGKEAPKKLPQIVIIVDELADLMMVSPGEVEESICRLAQLARAAGIHLIIATQRPSVDVITGLIKANMPSRVAFSVSSGVDSRTILDMNGAEKLLGKGDMLFYPQGYSKPARIQGAFVSDKEVSDVTDFLKNQMIGNVYASDIEEQMKSMGSAGGSGSMASEDNKDEYFAEAGRFIIEKDKASIGMLQRVFKIGFNRAARIMDQLAEYGVVGEEEGTKPRKVLMSPEQFEQLLEEI